MEGRNPLVRLHPIKRGLFARSLTLFFRFQNLISSSCHGVGFFSSRSSVCFVLLHFNIARMVTVGFLQVVALLDTVFLDTPSCAQVRFHTWLINKNIYMFFVFFYVHCIRSLPPPPSLVSGSAVRFWKCMVM